MAGFSCPYCGMIMAINDDTKREQHPWFGGYNGKNYVNKGVHYSEATIEVRYYKCPHCNQYTVFAKGMGNGVEKIDAILQPQSTAKQYPEYIPEQIRSDYEEACAIVRFSPKAAATLARRCLQGMIRDYWGIVKNTLYDEISALKENVQPDLWSAIDGLRQLGNIGAHMEKNTDVIVDIDPGEAETLIRLIELLMKEWYINREERKKLFGDIMQINADKQAARKGEG